MNIQISRLKGLCLRFKMEYELFKITSKMEYELPRVTSKMEYELFKITSKNSSYSIEEEI